MATTTSLRSGMVMRRGIVAVLYLFIFGRTDMLASVVLTDLESPIITTTTTSDNPNIVWISVQNIGFGDLGCYGHPYAYTPNVDRRLAAEGIQFQQFHILPNFFDDCCETEMIITTTTDYTVDDHDGDRTSTEPTHCLRNVTDILQKVGYHTTTISPKASNMNPQNDDPLEIAMNFMETSQEQPFFFSISMPMTNLVDTLSNNDPVRANQRSFANPIFNRNDFGFHMQRQLDAIEQRGENVSQLMHDYLEIMRTMDARVGRLLDKLEDLGISQSTVVIFSGSGTTGTEHKQNHLVRSTGKLRSGGNNQYEGDTRVPLIVRWPGKIPAGRIDNQSVLMQVDLVATVLSLAMPSSIPVETVSKRGEDMSDVWMGASRSRSSPLLYRHPIHHDRVFIRYCRWKLHVFEKELYDLSIDEEERLNIYEEYPEVVAELLENLKSSTVIPTAGRSDRIQPLHQTTQRRQFPALRDSILSFASPRKLQETPAPFTLPPAFSPVVSSTSPITLPPAFGPIPGGTQPPATVAPTSLQSCSICPSGQDVTNGDAILPAGTAFVITEDQTCDETESLARSGTYSQVACVLLQSVNIAAICGCMDAIRSPSPSPVLIQTLTPSMISSPTYPNITGSTAFLIIRLKDTPSELYDEIEMAFTDTCLRFFMDSSTGAINVASVIVKGQEFYSRRLRRLQTFYWRPLDVALQVDAILLEETSVELDDFLVGLVNQNPEQLVDLLKAQDFESANLFFTGLVAVEAYPTDSVRPPPPSSSPVPAPEEPDTDDNALSGLAIFGIVALTLVIVGTLAYGGRKYRRKNQPAQVIENRNGVSNEDHAATATTFPETVKGTNGAAASGLETTDRSVPSQSRDEQSVSDASASTGGRMSKDGSSTNYAYSLGAKSADAKSSAHSKSHDDESSHGDSAIIFNNTRFVSRTVMAPPGKLGIIIDTTLLGPTIHKVNDQSPMVDLLSTGEIIAAINDIDTQCMSIAEITALMAQTTNQERKLTVLSEDLQ